MNKLKKAAQKVTMPEELKKKILHEAEVIAHAESEGYEDSQVFTVEKARPNHITHIISAAAACVVLVGGIGIAGINLSRSESTSETLSEEAGESEEYYELPPFGDITQHTLAEVLRNSSPDELTEEQVQQIADIFARQKWEETELPEEEKDDMLVSDHRYTIEYWFKFTDSTSDVVNEGFYICNDGILCFLTPTGTLYYKTDFETLDTELREILGYPEKVPMDDNLPEFLNVMSEDRSLPYEASAELCSFINSQNFELVDISSEEAAELGTSFSFSAWDKNQIIGQYVMLYRTGYLQYSLDPELKRIYKVEDYASFNQTVGDIITENSGVTGKNAPFGEFEKPIFNVYDINETQQLHNIYEQSNEIQEYFMSMYWEAAEPADDFGASGKGVIFRASDDDYEASLTVDLELGLAKYHVSRSNDGSSYNGETFYKIDPQDIYFAVYRWCRVPYNAAEQVCPFAAFIADQDAMRCIIDLDKVDLDKDDFAVYEENSDDRYLYAFIENNDNMKQLISVVGVLNDGLDWTDCRFDSYDQDSEPVFRMYSADFHGTGNELYGLFIYEDGTVNVQFDSNTQPISFKNVDGGTGTLYKTIEKNLQR